MLLADESLPPSLAALRGLMRSRQPAAERCELCGLELMAEHEHLVEPAARRLVCSCTPCAILFDGRDSGRFRRVRRSLERTDDFQITDAAWQSLLIPIDLAFFYISSAAGGAVAIYPSAAGPIESQLPPDAWEELRSANPRLKGLAADVEAILVNRLGKRREYYRLSIDRCYELIGLIRMHWRGFSGGSEVWKQIEEFFDKLRDGTGGKRIEHGETGRVEAEERTMPELKFSIDGTEPIPYAAIPQLAFKLGIAAAEGESAAAIQSIALRVQIRIEPTKRRYDAASQTALGDLFGQPERWGQTMRSMLWTHVGLIVPSFSGEVRVDLPVPCSFDFNLAATKYFAALQDGEIPLCFLFSGTIFQHAADGQMQVGQISWEHEANFRLPAATWRAMMNHHYPNSAWLCLQRDAFARLAEYKTRQGLPTWEQAIERLLAAEPAESTC